MSSKMRFRNIINVVFKRCIASAVSPVLVAKKIRSSRLLVLGSSLIVSAGLVQNWAENSSKPCVYQGDILSNIADALQDIIEIKKWPILDTVENIRRLSGPEDEVYKSLEAIESEVNLLHSNQSSLGSRAEVLLDQMRFDFGFISTRFNDSKLIALAQTVLDSLDYQIARLEAIDKHCCRLQKLNEDRAAGHFTAAVSSLALDAALFYFGYWDANIFWKVGMVFTGLVGMGNGLAVINLGVEIQKLKDLRSKINIQLLEAKDSHTTMQMGCENYTQLKQQAALGYCSKLVEVV
jgi:hypothetical protein